MRNLLDIIDRIIEIAPDLEKRFSSLKSSISYTAPELMVCRWHQAAHILNNYALEHPKQKEIAAIFKWYIT